MTSVLASSTSSELPSKINAIVSLHKTAAGAVDRDCFDIQATYNCKICVKNRTHILSTYVSNTCAVFWGHMYLVLFSTVFKTAGNANGACVQNRGVDAS